MKDGGSDVAYAMGMAGDAYSMLDVADRGKDVLERMPALAQELTSVRRQEKTIWSIEGKTATSTHTRLLSRAIHPAQAGAGPCWQLVLAAVESDRVHACSG